ncbi:hypothetical protein FACS189487_01840 [Campylobacterota bacterium]|nr:hypothetical protein FACS189487_01840 [Campylobacterota bacterium]
MEANVDLDEQRAMVEAFFLSQSTFESELFLVNDPGEMLDVMRTAAKGVLDRPTAKSTVNFRSLQSYSQFNITGCIVALKEQINEEIEYLIREEAGFDPVIAKEVRADQKKQAFILNQAKRYFIDYQKHFREAIADTFFDRVANAIDMNLIDKVVQEVIDGIGNLAPVLVNASGAMIVRKGNQIWMRLKQAKILKDKEAKAAKENVDRLTKKCEGIERNIKAIEDAKELTLEKVQAMTLDELKEIVIDEDGSRTELKRIFQFTPAGDISIYLAEQMDRGRRGGRNEVQKSEYKRATIFYENCNVNNTPKELANKILMFETELPKVKTNLEAAIRKADEIEGKGLYTYDDSLMKMRQAFIENIGKPRI